MDTAKKTKRKVQFGMFWEVYGQQTIDLPDDIDENDTEAILDYIREVWDDVPLPSGSYVGDSAEVDEESMITVFQVEELE